MHVRTTTVTGATDIDGGVAHIRNEAEPQVRQETGFRGISISADRVSGLVIVLSQWESEADLEASESTTAKVRSDALHVLGGQASVDRYEQLLWETVGEGPRPGAKLFIRGIQMEPARVDDHFAFFRDTILPEIKASPGLVGVRNLVNRETGQGRVATVWSHAGSRAEYMTSLPQRQARAESRGIKFIGDMSLEVLYAAMS